MRLVPSSYNGFFFQQTNKVASDFQVPFDWNIGGIDTNEIPRSQNYPLRAAKQYSGAIKVVNVHLLDVDFSRDDLVIAMDVLGEEQGQLIATDEFGRAWYVNADFVGLTEDTTSAGTVSFGATFAVDDPVWKKLIPSTQTILVDGTGNGTITPIGNQPALPVITITPTGVGGFGFAYKRFIQIVNNSPNALTNYPLNLTGAGLDTAALVSGGKMLASGDDLRVYVDGVEVKRWFGGGGINSTTTKIWINWTQPANTNMTLGTAIASSGDVDTIQIENTPANVALMPTIPVTGNVLIGSEVFVYTGVNVGLLQLTGVTRAERQTVAAAHSTGATIKFVTHDVWLYYGNASIDPYVEDDTYKPIIDLDSINTSWVYEEFASIISSPTGAWITQEEGVTNGYFYRGSEDLTNPDFYEVMGVFLGETSASSPDGSKMWRLYQPCGVTTVTVSGKKYRDTEKWDAHWFQKSLNGIDWGGSSIWAENSPGAEDTWETLDFEGTPVSLSGTYYYLRLRATANTADPAHNTWYEIGDATIAIDSAKVPTINIAAEAGNFTLHSVLTNAATNESMTIELSMELDTALIVDTKEKTIKLYDGTNEINSLLDMPIRLEWFRLLPKRENIITITDAGIVVYKLDWEDRSL